MTDHKQEIDKIQLRSLRTVQELVKDYEMDDINLRHLGHLILKQADIEDEDIQPHEEALYQLSVEDKHR